MHQCTSVFSFVIGQFMCAKVSKVAVNPQTVLTGSRDYLCNQAQHKHSLSGTQATGIAESLWPTHGMHDNLLVREGSLWHTTLSGLRQDNKRLDKHLNCPWCSTYVTCRHPTQCWIWKKSMFFLCWLQVINHQRRETLSASRNDDAIPACATCTVVDKCTASQATAAGGGCTELWRQELEKEKVPIKKILKIIQDSNMDMTRNYHHSDYSWHTWHTPFD